MGVLNLVFKIADDNGLLLLDLKDLRSMLQHVGDNAKQFTTEYGNISAASVGAIQRGLVAIERQQSVWACGPRCVLFSEAGVEMQPPQIPDARPVSRDFADLAWFDGKLFTLERNAYRICRRDADSGQVERCWSFAADALTEPRRYDQLFGVAEALVVDAEGAWIGLDNNEGARADGERRPIVWRFAAPAGGWSAKP